MSTGDGDTVSKVWKSAAMVIALGFIFAASWGYSQSQRANQLEGQLQTTQQQLQEASKRDLPISVSFRQALLGSGLVAIIKNTSGMQLEVSAEFISKATGESKRANLVIPASGELQYGHAEGWAFVSGQELKLSNTQFRGVIYTVPTF